MARNIDNAPVGHTCPMIDGVIDVIMTIYRSSEEMSKGDCDYLDRTLNKIRSHNDELRTWGNEMYDRVQDLEKEVDNLTGKIDDLKDNLLELDKEFKLVVSA